MNTLKRLSATLLATVDRTVNSMEDHEAVISAAIRDSRKATARARFKLEKLKADNTRLKDRINTLQQQHDKWQERAISLNSVNREDALNCIARGKRCAEQIESLSTMLEQQQKLEQQSINTVRRLSEKSDSLNSKRTQLSSRAAAAEATRVINRLEGEDGIEIDDTLGRWEQSVYETEAVFGMGEGAVRMDTLGDELDERLSDGEEQQDLSDELDALVADVAGKQSQAEQGHD